MNISINFKRLTKCWWNFYFIMNKGIIGIGMSRTGWAKGILWYFDRVTGKHEWIVS